MNAFCQGRVWGKKNANRIHPLNVFTPLKGEFPFSGRHSSANTQNPVEWLRTHAPEIPTLAGRRRCWPRSRSPARVRGKVPCSRAPRQQPGVKLSVMAAGGTAVTSHHTMSNILRRYATYESRLVIEGTDSAGSCLFCEHDGKGKAEDEGNYIYYRDLFIFVYRERKYLSPPAKCDI